MWWFIVSKGTLGQRSSAGFVYLHGIPQAWAAKACRINVNNKTLAHTPRLGGDPIQNGDIDLLEARRQRSGRLRPTIGERAIDETSVSSERPSWSFFSCGRTMSICLAQRSVIISSAR
jgi:hypothetical protein